MEDTDPFPTESRPSSNVPPSRPSIARAPTPKWAGSFAPAALRMTRALGCLKKGKEGTPLS